MLELTLRDGAHQALAHAIKPIVWIGRAGRWESVIHELDQGLKSQELIKIKVSGDERETRNALLDEIASAWAPRTAYRQDTGDLPSQGGKENVRH